MTLTFRRTHCKYRIILIKTEVYKAELESIRRGIINHIWPSYYLNCGNLIFKRQNSSDFLFQKLNCCCKLHFCETRLKEIQKKNDSLNY